MTEFDAFISYQWNVKPTVKCLYNYLKKKKNLKIWIDMHEMGSTNCSVLIKRGKIQPVGENMKNGMAAAYI